MNFIQKFKKKVFETYGLREKLGISFISFKFSRS